MSTFKKLYNEQITNSLMEKFNYSSKMEIPKLEWVRFKGPIVIYKILNMN